MNYSVLMTVYKNDNPAFFRKSIESMLNQTVSTNEFVIVKDGPITSELQQVIDFYMNKYKKLFVQVAIKQNVGLGKALNEGLKFCTNDLVARMDSDDIALPKRCELQLAEFKKNSELDILGAPVNEFTEDETKIIRVRQVPLTQEDIIKFGKQRNPFNHSTVMYKKNKVLACGGYSDLRTNQDVELWIRMLMAGCKVKNLEEPLVLFRFDNNTYRRRKNWNNIKSLIRIWYRMYKKGFCSLFDFVRVCVNQGIIIIVPINVLKWIYTYCR